MLFIVSVEDACVYTSNSNFDWIFDYGACHHVTPCKNSFVSYNSGDYRRVHWGIIIYAILLEWEMSRSR